MKRVRVEFNAVTVSLSSAKIKLIIGLYQHAGLLIALVSQGQQIWRIIMQKYIICNCNFKDFVCYISVNLYFIIKNKITCKVLIYYNASTFITTLKLRLSKADNNKTKQLSYKGNKNSRTFQSKAPHQSNR